MIRMNVAYIGDAWCRIGNSLQEEKTQIATKSVFAPTTVTLEDVRFAIFNEKTCIELDSDDDEDFNGGCDDAFAAGDDYVRLKKPKVKWVPPSELPGGNVATPVVWTSDTGNDYTCESLIALAAERRLGLQADRMNTVAAEEQQRDHESTPMPPSDLDDDVMGYS